MIRVAFNGGELSPQVQMRADLDVFQRGCSCVENFDIGQAGGVTRRRGFRRFARAQGPSSRIFAYRYSNEERYLVEVGEAQLKVFSVDGKLASRFVSPYSAGQVRNLRVLQVNSLLLLVCAESPPRQLRCDADGCWYFEEYSFKQPAWRWSGARDYEIKVARLQEDEYEVLFPEGVVWAEQDCQEGDLLRVSYYTEQSEVKMQRADAFAMVSAMYAEGFIGSDTSVEVGTVIAVRRAPERIAYTALNAWKGSEKFVKGLIDPANYKADFQEATEVPADAKVVAELTASASYTKGQVFWYDSGYWDIFTCTSAFDGTVHFLEGNSNPEDYPGHFVRGLMLGAAPCKGKWQLHLSGTWYGSYEVRACYEGSGMVSDVWEYRAEAWSRNSAPVNEPVGGDEGDEECYLSLWLTRVRAYGETLTERCFPADSCGNELVVCSYKHDMLLQAKKEKLVVEPATARIFRIFCTNGTTAFKKGGDKSILTFANRAGVLQTIRIFSPSLSYIAGAISRDSNDHVASVEYDEESGFYYVEIRWTVLGSAGNNMGFNYATEYTDVLYASAPGKDEVVKELRSLFKRVDKIRPAFSGELKSDDWSWQAWCAKYGFPRLAAMFNQRLVLAGTDAQPLTIWVSQTDDLDNFAITDEATSAMALTVNAETQDPIRWMVAQGGRILLGTSEGEHVVQSGDAGVMTNANAVISAHGFVGASNVAAMRGNDRVIYFERGGGRAMQYGYDQSQDAYISTDLTVYAEHVLAGGGGVVEGCFLRKPDSKAVMVLDNGQLALMTYNAHHHVNAWHRYVTRGSFLSVAMLPNGDKPDGLYAIVEREPDSEDVLLGETKAYWIEVCDESSTYQDANGIDYTSTLLTNALNVTRLGGAKQVSPTLWLYLHEPCEVSGVELTVDGGETWTRVPRQPNKALVRGWHKLSAVPNVDMERCVGFRCSGNQGMSVGALQA